MYLPAQRLCPPDPIVEEIECPICGAFDPETFFFDKYGELFGCCDCVRQKDISDIEPEDLRL